MARATILLAMCLMAVAVNAQCDTKTSNICPGAVVETKLATGAVTTTKIQKYAITAAKIASNAINTGKIQDKAITLAKLSQDVQDALAAANSNVGPTGPAGNNGATGATGPTGSSVPQTIDALSITGGQIAGSAIGTNKLADDAVTTLKIIDAAVTAAKLGPNSVGTGKIIDGSIAFGDWNAYRPTGGNPQGKNDNTDPATCTGDDVLIGCQCSCSGGGSGSIATIKDDGCICAKCSGGSSPKPTAIATCITVVA